MSEIGRLVLLGLATGALYGLLTQGLVLIYRGSGILNFAQGGFVLIGGYSFYELHAQRQLPVILVIPIAVAVGAIVGGLVNILAIRRMRQSSPIARVVATLGVLIVIQALAMLRYGDASRSVPPFLPTNSVHLFADVAVGLDRILIFVLAALIVAGLWVAYRFTDFGRATNAVAENEDLASLLGHSPAKIATTNWALGGALGALTGCLIAPITFLQPGALVMLIVPALAAALLGGFSSFVWTFVGALAIGVAETLASGAIDTPGWPKSIPLIAVVVILIVKGRGLPLRSHVQDKLPKVGAGRLPLKAVGAVALGFVLLDLFVLSDAWANAVAVTMALAILCLSVVVVTGMAGQLSLMQYVIAGFGALVAAQLVANWSWPLLPAMGAAVALTGFMGALVALPALRTRGINLAIVTFCMATVLHALVLSNPDLGGGVLGITVGSPSIFGLDLDPFFYPQRYALFVFVFLIVAVMGVANLRRGSVGRRLLAVRANERAAAASGVNVFAAKLYAFTVGAVLAAIAGILLAFANTTVIPAQQFNVFPSVEVVAMTVVGGIGSVGGAMFGSTLLPGGIPSELFRGWEAIDAYMPLIGGLMLLQILTTDQDGLVSLNRKALAKVPHGFTRRGAPRAHPAQAVDLTEQHDDMDDAQQLGIVPRSLAVSGLSITFGTVRAVSDVTLEVRPGEVHGLIGPNGAGKTTFIDGISGFVKPRSGSVSLNGVEVASWNARRLVRGGVSRSFQSLELFEDLTIRENIAVACDRGSWWRHVTDLVVPGSIVLNPAARAAIRMFGLTADLDRLPNELSFGQRRLAGIARTIASEPSILLLDEPASGLDDKESEELAAQIRVLASQQMGVLLIEHNLEMVLSICDRVTVLAQGRVIATGTPQEIRSHHDVMAAYTGETPRDVGVALNCPMPPSGAGLGH